MFKPFFRPQAPGRFLPLAVIALVAGLCREVQAQDPGPAPVAKALCDALLNAMKEGPSVSYAARRDQLAPEISRDLDLPLMTRLVVGPSWRTLAPADREQLVDAFSAYSIATYAQRFRSYSGERFEVAPTASPSASGDSIVHTKLFTGDGSPVQLDYLMRKNGDRWQIMDVFLNGTISELAARRSEYSSVLREGGAPALISLLKKKTAEFGG